MGYISGVWFWFTRKGTDLRRYRFPILLGLTAGLLLSGCNDEQDLANVSPAAGSGGEKAELSFVVRDFSYEFIDGRHRYTHVREFSETAGVDVTITRGRVCVEQGKTCVDALVTYKVPAGGKFVKEGHYVATRDPADNITIEYWATDSGGNTHLLSAAFKTDRTEITPQVN